MLVAEAEHHGTIESDERRMIAGVMRLGDRAVRAVMTPRTEVDWINLAGRRGDDPQAADGDPAFAPAGRRRRRRRHDRRRPDPRGAGRHARRPRFDPRKHVRARRSSTTRPTRWTCWRRSRNPTCRWRWSTTNTAISKASSPRPTFWRRSPACSGPISTPARRNCRPARGRLMAARRLHAGRRDGRPSRHRPARKPRLRDRRRLSCCRMMHRLPATGECVDAQGWRFEVVDLDGRRIDKVIATPAAAEAAGSDVRAIPAKVYAVLRPGLQRSEIEQFR